MRLISPYNAGKPTVAECITEVLCDRSRIEHTRHVNKLEDVFPPASFFSSRLNRTDTMPVECDQTKDFLFDHLINSHQTIPQRRDKIQTNRF